MRVNLVPFLTKISSGAIDRALGKNANNAAKPVNKFISQVNNVFGTHIRTISPTSLLKSAVNGQINSLFGKGNKGKAPSSFGTLGAAGIQNLLNQNLNGSRPSATTGKALLSSAISVSDYSGGRQPTPIETVGKAITKGNVLSEMSKRFDPVTNFEWMAVIRNRGSQSLELPWYYVDEITVPMANFAATNKYINGREIKYADMFSVNTCTIKIYSDVSGMAFNYCDKWCKSVYRDDNLYQMPSEYKKDIYIFILDITRQVVVNVQLIGVWPTAWADYQLIGNASGQLETSLTLSVDDFKMNYSDNPEEIASKIERSTTGNTGTGKGVSGMPGSGMGTGFGAQNIGQGMMQNVMSDMEPDMMNSSPAGSNLVKDIIGNGGVSYPVDPKANISSTNEFRRGALNNILKF